MKKAIVSLLVLALAVTGAFAAVDFSGELVAGYAFQYNDKNDEWTNHIMGQDGEDTNTTKLNLGIADEDGLWKVTIEGTPTIDDSGAVSGDLSVDLAKLIAGPETDWTAAIGLNVLDRMTGLRAYAMADDLDRVRTAETGVWASLTLGYSDFVKLFVGGSPKTVDTTDTNNTGANEGDFMVSALVAPLDGLAVSATYVLKGDAQDSGLDAATMNNFADGIVGASADINLAKQLNIMLKGLSIAPENIVMNVGTAAVGYGFEYVASTLDRIRMAALAQSDDDLQMPIVSPVSPDAWSVKESTASEEDEPAWGNQEERGIEMEISTAAANLVGGADAVIMRHPAAIATIKKFITELV